METNSEAPRSVNHKKPSVSLRTMGIDDLAQVFHLGERLFTAEEVPNLYRTWDEYEVVGLFQTDSPFCLVADCEDKVVGFALGATVEKPRSAWKYGHLIWLGVEPDMQAHGVGKKLFLEMRDLMIEDGVRIMMVDTQADNDQAIRFFRKQGFGKPENHVYLALNISLLEARNHHHREPHSK